MAKKVRAVMPYIRKGIVNFKMGPYEAWGNIGGEVAVTRYPCIRNVAGFFHNHELPSLWKSKKEARLRFMEPINRMFDAFGGTKYGIPDNLDNSLNSQHWDSGNVRQAMLDAGGNAFWGFSNFAAKTTFNGEVGFWVYTFGGSIPDGGLWGWRTNSYPRAVRLCFVF